MFCVSGIFQTLQNSITGDGVFPLKQGLAVFPSTAFPLAPSYLELVQTQFGGKAQGLSYASQMEAMDSINSWAMSQTEDEVKDVVGSLDTETKLLLVSVAYYKGKEEVRNARVGVHPPPSGQPSEHTAAS